MRVTLTVLAMLVLVSACRRPAPDPVAVPARMPADSSAPQAAGVITTLPFTRAVLRDSMRIQFPIPNRPGQLSLQQLIALGPQVTRFVADPDSVSFALGDSIFIGQQVRILAVDREHRVLGEVRTYGFRMNSGLYPNPSGAIKARSAGEHSFETIAPRAFRDSGLAEPTPARLRVFVVGANEAATLRPRRASVVGIVRDEAERPVSQAMISVMRAGTLQASVMADSAGQYRLVALPTGVVRVEVRAVGYRLQAQEVLLEAGDSLRLDVVLRRVRSPLLDH